MMRLLCLLLVIISFPGLGQERVINMDSMHQVMENRRKIRQIYLDNLAKFPKKTLDSVYQAQREIYAEIGLERLQELRSNTRLDTLKEINLSYAGLKEIPDIIYNAINVERLILDHNDIRKLPNKLCRLKRLKYISWTNNGLDDFWWIRIGNLDQIETLILSDNTLKRVPIGIRKLDGLKNLVLDQNLFEEFPVRRLARNQNIRKLVMNRCAWMKIAAAPYEKLSLIEGLHLNRCNISSIHPSFYQLSGLKELQMLHNDLTMLPDGVSGMENLSKLSFYKNKLSQLPLDFFELTKLEVVDLYYNKLEVIPEQLSKLKNLEILYLAHNEIYDIPESIGELNRLKELYLHHNRLSVLPESISRLESLKVIRINDNYLVGFPNQVLLLDKLKDIDISNNQITQIPPDISSLTRLSLFSFNGNEIDFKARENQQLAVELNKMIERGVICVPKVYIDKSQ